MPFQKSPSHVWASSMSSTSSYPNHHLKDCSVGACRVWNQHRKCIISKKKKSFSFPGFSFILSFILGILRIWMKKNEKPSSQCSKYKVVWKHVKNCEDAHETKSKLQMFRRWFVTQAQIVDQSLLSWWLQPGNVSPCWHSADLEQRKLMT